MITSKSPLHGILILGASCLAVAGPAKAQTAPDAEARIAALEAQLAALAGQIADLKAATAAASAALAAAPPKEARPPQTVASATIAGGKPAISSSDGAFSIAFHGVMQMDAAQYVQDKTLPAVIGPARDLNSGTTFRRVHLGVDGKFFRDFSYRVRLDLGGSGTDGSGELQEVYLQYDYRPVSVKVGVFAPNLGLEDAGSVMGSLFPERPSAVEAARNLAGAEKRIALQAQALGEQWLLSGSVTGAKAGDAQTYDEQLAYVVRAAATPFKGKDWLIHTGVNASVVVTPAQIAPVNGAYPITIQDRPELRVDGQRLVTSGAIDASGARHLGLELAAQRKNLLIQGEYVDITVDRRSAAAGVSNPKFTGWYVESGWVLTGESRKYNTGTFAFDAPGIAKPFDPRTGQWGTWELVARYSVLDLNHHETAALAADRVRGGEQTISTFGVNWFPNGVIKFSLDYLDVSIDRQDPAGGLVGLSQDYQAVNFRSQFAF